LIIAVIAGYGQIRNNGPLIVEDVRSILAVVRGLTERPMELLNIATRLYADVHCLWASDHLSELQDDFGGRGRG